MIVTGMGRVFSPVSLLWRGTFVSFDISHSFKRTASAASPGLTRLVHGVSRRVCSIPGNDLSFESNLSKHTMVISSEPM